jgi:hypothetical protein
MSNQPLQFGQKVRENQEGRKILRRHQDRRTALLVIHMSEQQFRNTAW